MDHSGIGMIEELNKSFQDRGIRVIVCSCWNFIKNTSTHLTMKISLCFPFLFRFAVSSSESENKSGR